MRHTHDRFRQSRAAVAAAPLQLHQRHIAAAGVDQRGEVGILRVAARLAPDVHPVARAGDRHSSAGAAVGEGAACPVARRNSYCAWRAKVKQAILRTARWAASVLTAPSRAGRQPRPYPAASLSLAVQTEVCRGCEQAAATWRLCHSAFDTCVMTLSGGRSGGCEADQDLVGGAIGRDIVGCWRSLLAPQREGAIGCSATLPLIGEKRARRGSQPRHHR